MHVVVLMLVPVLDDEDENGYVDLSLNLFQNGRITRGIF